jgi:hypothetical protein
VVLNSFLEVSKLLLDYVEADGNIQNNAGRSPFSLSTESSHPDILAALVYAGENENVNLGDSTAKLLFHMLQKRVIATSWNIGSRRVEQINVQLTFVAGFPTATLVGVGHAHWIFRMTYEPKNTKREAQLHSLRSTPELRHPRDTKLG